MKNRPGPCRRSCTPRRRNTPASPTRSSPSRCRDRSRKRRSIPPVRCRRCRTCRTSCPESDSKPAPPRSAPPRRLCKCPSRSAPCTSRKRRLRCEAFRRTTSRRMILGFHKDSTLRSPPRKACPVWSRLRWYGGNQGTRSEGRISWDSRYSAECSARRRTPFPGS